MLFLKRELVCVLAAVLVLNSARAMQAQQPRVVPTVVTIEGEVCGGCVKKVKAALADMRGIAKIEGDPKAKTITIVPAAQVSLSPRAVWEAIEKAGKNPVKLAGPHGTFTAKPRG
ncbi:MAG: heavy-metal-associated domain-containing protein [Pirellulaceae bacterium]